MEENKIKPLEKYSYSKLSSYGQCHLKFKLHYLDKNYLFSESIATEFGTLVHATEEAIAAALQAKMPINYIELKNKFILSCKKLAHKYPEDWVKVDKSNRTYTEKMYTYLDSAIYRLEQFMVDNPELAIIGIEQKFEYNYDGRHSFTGSIDRAFINKVTGEILIQDIKTWPVPAQNSELKAPAQFTVYAMAAQQLWGIEADKIKCEYDLPLCNLRQASFSEDIIADGRPQLDKWFAGITKGDFKPTVSALCNWCQYNPLANPSILYTKPGAICPYFSTWQKSGDNVRDTLCKWEGLDNIAVDRQLVISQLRQQAFN
jgi:RecB family exonuclease